MEFDYASQDRVDRYPAEVDRILRAVGLSLADAAVSDESLLGDFYMGEEDEFTEAELLRLSTDFGIPVNADTVIADLAESLHAKAARR